MGLAKELRERREVQTRTVTVEAWADKDGKAFEMFCRPITCYDINVLQKKHPKIMENPTVGSMVDLMGEETTVISAIAEQMFTTIDSLESAEKN